MVVGDVVWTIQEGKAVATTVTSKAATKASGLHSPVLTHGTFPVVDGVITSFDSIDKVTLAKHGLSALISTCKATGTCASVRDTFLAGDHEYIGK